MWSLRIVYDESVEEEEYSEAVLKGSCSSAMGTREKRATYGPYLKAAIS